MLFTTHISTKHIVRCLIAPCIHPSTPPLYSLHSLLNVVRTKYTAAHSQPVAPLHPGCIIEHRLGGRPCLLLLQQSVAGGRSWIAVDQSGKQHIVKPQQVFSPCLGGTPDWQPTPGVAHAASDDILTDNDDHFTLDDLTAIETRARAMTNAVPAAWQAVTQQQESGRLLDVGTIATALDLRPEAPLDLFITYRALAMDTTAHFQLVKRYPRVLFRARRIGGVLKHSEQHLEGAVSDEDVLRITQALDSSTTTTQENNNNHPRHLNHPLVRAIPALQALWRFSVEPIHDVPSATTAMALLQRLDCMPTPASGTRILRRLGALSPHDPVPLFRAGVRAAYPPHLIEMAAQPLQPDPLESMRRDCTHHKIFVIDDPCTTEVDDGIAWDAESKTLYVHVADPVRALPLDSPIIKEAVSRTRTVYLPGQRGKYTMLPSMLSTTGGLVRDKQCCALTVAVRVDDDGALCQYEVFPSVIHPKEFLTYEASAALLPTCPDLSALHAFSQKRAARRLAAGALDLLQFEYTFGGGHSADHGADHHGGAASSPTPLDRQSTPTRALIAETMIAANEAVARWGMDHGVPLPFRSQAPPAVKLPSRDTATPAQIYAAVLPHLRAATVTARPAPHAGLGLTGYVQFTSPLRRVTDLLAHMQVHAVLQGNPPPFSVLKLDQVLDAVMETHRVLLRAEEEVELAYLAAFFADKKDTVFPGTVLSFKATETGRARVLLRDYGVAVMASLQGRAYGVGDAVKLVVDVADPEVPVLRFSAPQG